MPTPTLTLPLIEAGQAQKHVTHNEALMALDALVQIHVLSAALNSAPASPAPGARYIVGAAPTGAWAGKAGQLAYWDGTAWVFFAPSEGWLVWDSGADQILVRQDGAWTQPPSGNLFPGGIGIGGASPDATNRLAFYGTNCLFNSGSSIDLTLNKAAPSDDASFSFKIGWSVRALFGLLGDQNFVVKVSPDGGAFYEGIRVRPADGLAAFPAGVLADGLVVRDPTDPTKAAQFVCSGISTGTTRLLTLPNAATALAGLAVTQTFTGSNTFSGTFAVSATSASLGTSTATSTVNVGTGATTSGATKTINIGTGGAAGSTTNIALGPTAGGGGITLNTPVQLAGQAADPATPVDGQIWHSASSAQLLARVNGRTRALGAVTAPFLRPPAGGFVPTTLCGAAPGTVAGAADRFDLFPWSPRADLSIDQLAINCTTAVASATAKIVVYSSDANGRPGTLLTETAALDLGTTGVKTAAWAATLRESETYWFGVRHSATATISAWAAQATPDLPVAAVTTSAAKILRRTLAYATAAPSSYGFAIADVTAGLTAVAPAIWLRST